MNFTYVIHDDKEPYIELTGCLHAQRVLRLPAYVDGVSVQMIAPHAFERLPDVEEIILPGTILAVGAFAFYGCRSLRKLTMSDMIDGWGFGAIRFCDEMSELVIRMKRNRLTVLRDLLGDVDYAFRVILEYDDHTEGYYFPRYTRGFDEDTFARAIHTFTEGSGWAFRETVLRGGINAREYEKLFVRATYDGIQTGAEIALMRLMYPESLSDKATEQYRNYLKENAGEIFPWLVGKGERERCMFMLSEGLAGPGDVSRAIPIAVELHDPELVATLMEYRRVEKPADFDTFDLDDL